MAAMKSVDSERIFAVWGTSERSGMALHIVNLDASDKEIAILTVGATRVLGDYRN